MLRGLYTAGAGMVTETLRTDTISNNLANVNTTGYKKDIAVSEEVADNDRFVLVHGDADCSVVHDIDGWAG